MVILSNFVERLKEQMFLHNIDTKTLCEAIDVDPSTISHWKTEKYIPSTKAFFRLIDYFQCSADYMLGLTDFPTEGVTYQKPLCVYGARIRTLLKEKGISQSFFIKEMNISSNLAYRWLSDKALPSLEYLIKIAEYFDISIDVLIGRTI